MNNILQHYSQEQRKEIKQLSNTLNKVSNKNFIYEYGFTNLSTRQLLEDLLPSYSNVELDYYEIFPEQERFYLCIRPSSLERKEISFKFLTIKYNSKFGKITHPQILGTLLNSNIEFKMFGDIIISENEEFQILTTEKYCKEITYINNISKHKVKFVEDELFNNIKKKETKQIIVSSLRYDVVVKTIINKNRSYAKGLIDQKYVKVNDSIIFSTNKFIKKYDIISIKGFGRYKIIDYTEKQNKKFNVLVEF